ncbi:hypothetical protein SNEBB_000790 [Seison nebaliae]|nr:hypothetical protein SNEBB_000790 [Seison nebaliae]
MNESTECLIRKNIYESPTSPSTTSLNREENANIRQNSGQARASATRKKASRLFERNGNISATVSKNQGEESFKTNGENLLYFKRAASLKRNPSLKKIKSSGRKWIESTEPTTSQFMNVRREQLHERVGDNSRRNSDVTTDMKSNFHHQPEQLHEEHYHNDEYERHYDAYNNKRQQMKQHQHNEEPQNIMGNEKPHIDGAFENNNENNQLHHIKYNKKHNHKTNHIDKSFYVNHSYNSTISNGNFIDDVDDDNEYKTINVVADDFIDYDDDDEIGDDFNPYRNKKMLNNNNADLKESNRHNIHQSNISHNQHNYQKNNDLSLYQVQPSLWKEKQQNLVHQTDKAFRDINDSSMKASRRFSQTKFSLTSYNASQPPINRTKRKTPVAGNKENEFVVHQQQNNQLGKKLNNENRKDSYERRGDRLPNVKKQNFSNKSVRLPKLNSEDKKLQSSSKNNRLIQRNESSNDDDSTSESRTISSTTSSATSASTDKDSSSYSSTYSSTLNEDDEELDSTSSLTITSSHNDEIKKPSPGNIMLSASLTKNLKLKTVQKIQSRSESKNNLDLTDISNDLLTMGTGASSAAPVVTPRRINVEPVQTQSVPSVKQIHQKEKVSDGKPTHESSNYDDRPIRPMKKQDQFYSMDRSYDQKLKPSPTILPNLRSLPSSNSSSARKRQTPIMNLPPTSSNIKHNLHATSSSISIVSNVELGSNSKLKRQNSVTINNHKKHIPTTRPSSQDNSMKPYNNPDAMLHDALDFIKLEDWEKKNLSMTIFRRLATHHSNTLQGQIHPIMVALTKEVKNLRSQVARYAISTIGYMSGFLKRQLESDIDLVIATLLHKSGESIEFIRNDVLQTLDSLSENINANRFLACLITHGGSHKNTAVRCVTAQYIFAICSNRINISKLVHNSSNSAGPSSTKDLGERLFGIGATFMSDASAEIRYYGRSIYDLLIKSLSPDEFDRAFNRFLPANTQKYIQSKVQTIKSKGPGVFPTDSAKPIRNLTQSPSLRKLPSSGLSSVVNSARGNGYTRAISTATLSDEGIGSLGSTNSAKSLPGLNASINFNQHLNNHTVERTPSVNESIEMLRSKDSSRLEHDYDRKILNKSHMRSSIRRKNDGPRFSKEEYNEKVRTLCDEMASSNFRERQSAIEKFQIGCETDDRYRENNALIQIFDKFTCCLNDSNSKVCLSALESMHQLVPVLADEMTPILSNAIPAICNNLASQQKSHQRKASEILRTMVKYIDNSQLIQPLSTISQQNNKRKLPELFGNLANIVHNLARQKLSKQKAIELHVFPVIFNNLSQIASVMKGETLANFTKLVGETYDCFGDSLFEKANSHTARTARKIGDIQLQEALRKILDIPNEY